MVQCVHCTLSICIYHWVSKVQSVQSQYPFLSGPVSRPLPQGYQHQSDLPAVFRVFPPVNLSHSHLRSLSHYQTDHFLLAFLCLRRCRRNTSRCSPSLHCGSQVAISREHLEISAGQCQSPPEPGSGSSDRHPHVLF